MRPRNITTCGKQVLADGEELAQARDAATAEWIANALYLLQMDWLGQSGEATKRSAAIGVAVGLAIGIPLGILLWSMF